MKCFRTEMQRTAAVWRGILGATRSQEDPFEEMSPGRQKDLPAASAKAEQSCRSSRSIKRHSDTASAALKSL